MTQFFTPAPCTPEQRAEIAQHWANVRAGLRSDQPEPAYKTPREVIEMHKYLAMVHVEAAARHARQALEAAQ
jgi:hypothetical protein